MPPVHYQGIIHRDIKPANLLWTADRQTVKISDFGVSHLSGVLKRSGSSSNLSSILNHHQQQQHHNGGVDGTRTTNSLDDQALRKTEGSPAFMAPELCCPVEATPTATPPERNASDYFTQHASLTRDSTSTDRPPDGRRGTSTPSGLPGIGGVPAYRLISHPLPLNTFGKGERPSVGKGIDIWALGVTLFCLLFGRTPFKAPNEYELFNVIWREAVLIPEWMGIERQSTIIEWDHPSSDGPVEHDSRALVDLLGKLLKKDPRERISLEDVKVSSLASIISSDCGCVILPSWIYMSLPFQTHPWVLNNLDNTQEWVHETAPVGDDAVHVTNEEVANFSHPRRTTERVQKPLGGVRQSLRKAAIKLGLQRSTARESRSRSKSASSTSATASTFTSPQDRTMPVQSLAELALAAHPRTAQMTVRQANRASIYAHPPILGCTTVLRATDSEARPSSPLSSPLTATAGSSMFKRGFTLRNGWTSSTVFSPHRGVSGYEGSSASMGNRARAGTGPGRSNGLAAIILKGDGRWTPEPTTATSSACTPGSSAASSRRGSPAGLPITQNTHMSNGVDSCASSPQTSAAGCSGTIYSQHPHMAIRPATSNLEGARPGG